MNVDLYRKLFVHRSDVYAEQHEDRSYTPVKRELDDFAIEEHLEGFASYGTYVIEPQSTKRSLATAEPYPGTEHTVKYVVFDLDTYDADALAYIKRSVARLVSPDPATARLRCLMLEDSGGKGYHVWLFLSEPTPAYRVRAWAETVRAGYQTLAHTATPEWPPLEIFPKQDEVQEGAYGNLVKLPFGVHAQSKARAYLVVVPGWAGDLETVVPFDSSLIPEPAARPARTDDGESRTAPFACISRILEDGAGKGIRDNALYHFARYAVSSGLPDDLVLEWAQRVNEGFDPPLTSQEVATKVRSACRATNANPGCSADWLRGYCPGGDRCFAPGNDRGSSGATKDSTAPVEAADAWLSPEARRAKRLRDGD